MRSRPVATSSLVVLSAGFFLGLGCFLDATGFDSGGGAGSISTTTNPPVGGGGIGGTITTNHGGGGTDVPGGSGGTMMTTSTGGTGGMTGGSGGSTSSTGGTGGSIVTPARASCWEAKMMGMDVSGVIDIDPDGEMSGEPFKVYCDQVNDGGGWALVYNSVGDPMGKTTQFWNIPDSNKLDILGDPPSLATNYYNGKLYSLGKEYRDDAVDLAKTEVRGILRGTAASFDTGTMKFQTPMNMGSLSAAVSAYHFEAGWSSPQTDGDTDADNCAVKFGNVTQHYRDCFRYSLGADYDDDVDMGHLDGGWGPHIVDSTIEEINMNAANAGQPMLAKQASNPAGVCSRVNRISRFTRWQP
jgi:Fibrinogen beta and gamma chains, C-terminal globular domain